MLFSTQLNTTYTQYCVDSDLWCCKWEFMGVDLAVFEPLEISLKETLLDLNILPWTAEWMLKQLCKVNSDF